MKKAMYIISMLLFQGVSLAQESTKKVEVPLVCIKDSLFHQMVYSVVNDAKECPTTEELSCGIICTRHELQNTELYVFFIEPFDDLFLFIESLGGTSSWRTTTLSDIPIIFLFSDMDKFVVMDTSQITIDTKRRVTYEYIVCKDTDDVSEYTSGSLCLREEYCKENGQYLLQYKTPCISVLGSEKYISGNRVLYIIKE